MQESYKRKVKPGPTDVDIFVGKKIRLYRKLQGLSQSTVAEELGLTFQQIQKYEKGVNRVSAGRLYAFAALFNVGVEKFFSSSDVQSVVNDNDGLEFCIDNESVELVKLFQSIESQSLKRSLLVFIKAYLADHD